MYNVRGNKRGNGRESIKTHDKKIFRQDEKKIGRHKYQDTRLETRRYKTQDTEEG
jgi:hypothetical protein